MAPDPYRGGVDASRIEVLHMPPEAVGDPYQPIADAYPVHLPELPRPFAAAAEEALEVAREGEDPDAVLTVLHHEQPLAVNDNIAHPGQSQFRIAVMADRDGALQSPPLQLSRAGTRRSRHKARAAECRHRQGGQPGTRSGEPGLRS